MIKVKEPLEDRVLVKPSAPIEKTNSGIIIPPSAQGTLEKLRHGKVILTGAEVKLVGTDDLIMFGQYTGTEIQHEGIPHLMMREADIICIVGVDKADGPDKAVEMLMERKDGETRIIDIREPGVGC